MTEHYREDLAYIHDVGSDDYAPGSGPAAFVARKP